MDLLVDIPFIACQVQLGKKPVFGKHIIGDDRACVQHPGDVLLLPVAAQQEEHLGLEGVLSARFIELGEKGVFFKHFEEKAAVKMLSEHARQCRFADANGSLDDNVPGTGHGLFGQGRLPITLGYQAPRLKA